MLASVNIPIFDNIANVTAAQVSVNTPLFWDNSQSNH